jgi:acetate kinase
VAAVIVPESPVLAVNSGSSSLKFGFFVEREGDEVALLRGGADGIGRPDGTLKITDADDKVVLNGSYPISTQGHALDEILKAIARIGGGTPGGGTPVAVGHRIVHGGPQLREHQRITPELIATLQGAVHFAPLHIPPALALISETERLLPHARQYACFDTAFHFTMPPTAFRYGLPEELYRKGVQRYGFHGLSYESVVHRLGNPMPSRIVCAHLGSGASLVALRDGRSVDTSMGMTPTGGIPMATRCGDLDPGILLFLMRTENANADSLEKLLNRESGLAALSGGETDMRQLQSAMEKGDAAATLAIQVFAGAVRKFIGAYAAELGGLDLLVFTGGIGEHSRPVRALICAGLDFLGITGGEPVPGSKVMVMTSEEEAQIARHCRRLMNS